MKNKLIQLAIFTLLSVTLYAQDYWQEINKPENKSIYEVYGIDSNNILVGASDGLYTTYDGGETWEHTIETISHVYAINVYNDVFYAIIPPNTYKRVGLNGEWFSLNEKGGASGHYYFFNDSTFLMGAMGSINITTDGGYTWNPLSEFQLGETVKTIDQHPSGALFAGTHTEYSYYLGVYKSLDTGVTWQKIGFENYESDFIRINNAGDIYLGCYFTLDAGWGGVFKSIDTGRTWQTLHNSMFVTGLIVTPGDTVYASSYGDGATLGGVFMSPDGGQNWENITSNIEYPKIYKLRLGRDGHLYAIKDGNIDKLYRSIRPITNEYVGVHDKDLNFKNRIIVYPNPAKNMIHLSKHFNTNVKYTIYTTFGKRIAEGLLLPGNSLINIESLKPGFYVLKLSQNQKKSNVKFLKN